MLDADVLFLTRRWNCKWNAERKVRNTLNDSAIGIDLGITAFATLSDGTKYSAPNVFRRSEKRLARVQRKLSRKQKFSVNWRKQLHKVQKMHKIISDIRRDFLHKVTTIICKNHAVVVIEDLGQ